jgi:hypothetical protein
VRPSKQDANELVERLGSLGSESHRAADARQPFRKHDVSHSQN